MLPHSAVHSPPGERLPFILFLLRVIPVTESFFVNVQRERDETDVLACQFCFRNTDHISTIPKRVFSFKVAHSHAPVQYF